MPWGAGDFGGFGSILGGIADAGRLDELERLFWLDFWRVAVRPVWRSPEVEDQDR